MQEYKVLKDGKEFTAPDIETFGRWLEERRISPNDQIYLPDLQKWIYIKDMLNYGSEYDPIGLNYLSCIVFLIIVTGIVFLLISVFSQNKFWEVSIFLLVLGITIVSLVKPLRKNVIESIIPRLRYKNPAINKALKWFLIAMIIYMFFQISKWIIK